MEITINQRGESVSWKTDHDDCSLDTIVPAIRGLLVSAGFHPKSVEQYFEEDAWSWEDPEDE